jgi:hypothetical protein
MSIRSSKPWQSIEPAALAAVPGQLGVFELADDAQCVLYIGVADARCLFGLRSELARCAALFPDARSFRIEVTSAYHTRYLELLMVYRADYDALPRHNEPMPSLGRLTPG